MYGLWVGARLNRRMSAIIPPSSAPLPADREAENNSLPIASPGQICYERVLPAQDHYYKIPKPPKCTGKQ